MNDKKTVALTFDAHHEGLRLEIASGLNLRRATGRGHVHRVVLDRKTLARALTFDQYAARVRGN